MKTEIFPMTEENYRLVYETASKCLKEAWSEQTYYEQLSNPNDRTYLCMCDGVPCGFLSAWYIAGEIDINNIAVLPEYRRLGIASELLQRLFDDFPQAERVFLEVRESNHAAIKLYEKFGFSRSGLRKNFYSSPDENALVLSL